MTKKLDENIRVGDAVTFTPKKGKPRSAVVEGLSPFSGTYIVLLDGDPFPVEVRASRITGQNNPHTVGSQRKVPKSGTKTGKQEGMTETVPKKLDAKKLRKQAVALGIEGWEDMGLKEMSKAVKRARRRAEGGDQEAPKKSKPKKTKPKASAPAPAEEEEEKPVKKSKPKTKKAPAKAKPAAKKTTVKKTAAKKAAKKVPAKTSKPKKTAAVETEYITAKVKPSKPLPAEGVNPFRKSAGIYVAASLLLQGGTRRSLAEKLSKKVDLHPYRKGAKEVNLKDYDKRLLLAAQTMRNQFGYVEVRSGRSLDGKIQVIRPGGPKDPRKSAGQKTSGKASSKAPGKASKKR